MADWNIQSSVGDLISLVEGDSSQINFILYYNDIIREEPYKVTIKDRTVATYNKGEFTGLSNGETICKVSLINSPEIEKTFTLKVSDVKEESFVIIGPERVKVEGAFEFTIVGNKEDVSFESESGHFTIESVEGDIITIRGNSIGKDKIIAKKGSDIIFEKIVNVESIWMEG